jgi:hypothetical protein
MDDVVLLVQGTVHEVADDPRILRNLHADGVFDCPHRGQSMDVRSNPAGALHEMLGIPRIAPLKNELDAPEHRSGAPGISHFAPGHLNLDLEVALDSGDWINRDSLSHMISSIFVMDVRRGY